MQFTNTEQRLVTMSASLCTQTGSLYLTIQVLNINIDLIDSQYNSLTSVALHDII